MSRSDALPPELESSRVVVVSRICWVGVEHKPHLPRAFAAANHPDDLQTLRHEVDDVQRRAPDLAVQLPPVWSPLVMAAASERSPCRFCPGSLR